MEQEGRDVLFVLDISRSRLAADKRPTRLDFIKPKIRTLIDLLKADRVGLVLFSGSAFVQCPLTVDHDAFRMYLDQVDVETIASGTTSLDAALMKAIEVFQSGKGRKNKLVVLATDGEDFSSYLSSVRSQAERENIKLFAMGIGSPEGAPVPIIDARGRQVGHEKLEDGTVALTKLNEELLQSLCDHLGGVYVRTTYGDGDIDHIVGAIEVFERERFGERAMSMYEEQYPWLVGLALVALLIEWVL